MSKALFKNRYVRCESSCLEAALPVSQASLFTLNAFTRFLPPPDNLRIALLRILPTKTLEPFIKLIPSSREKARVFRAAIFTEMTNRGHRSLAFRDWKTDWRIRDPGAYDASLHIFQTFRKGRVTLSVVQRSHWLRHASGAPCSLASAFSPLSHRFDRISKGRKGRRTRKMRRMLQANRKGISKASPPFAFAFGLQASLHLRGDFRVNPFAGCPVKLAQSL